MPPVRGVGCEMEPGLVTSMGGRAPAGTTGTGCSKGVAAAMARVVRAGGAGEKRPGQRI